MYESQKRANRKYLKANPDKRREYQYRSNAKTFINKYASYKDISDLRKLLDQREQALNENNQAR